MRIVKVLNVILFSFLLLSNIPCQGQVSANGERGLKGQSYLTDTIDSVNLYSGNLTLTVPVGQAYRVGGNLTYKLALINNSSVWNLASTSQLQQNALREVIKCIPDPVNNAGLGWNLSLGLLYSPKQSMALLENEKESPWLYIASDGARFEFHETIRQNAPDTDPGVLYTRDGSYLRLTAGSRTIEFPDGQVHHFNQTTGMVEKIEDSYGNALIVDDLYNTGDAPRKWVLTEKTASGIVLRTHTVKFTYSLHSQKYLVSEVNLAAFEGAVATYRFFYHNAAITRSNRNTYQWPAGQELAKVNILERVDLPANAGDYEFTNFEPGTGSLYSGFIRSVVLPAGGKYEWDYTLVSFPEGRPACGPQDCTEVDFGFNFNVGVAAKRIYNSASSSNPVGTYSYRHEAYWPMYSPGIPIEPNPGEPFPWRIKTTVSSPEGDDTVHYFNISRFGPGGAIPWDYGLPYSAYTSDPDFPEVNDASITGSDGQRMFLSKEIYKGSSKKGEGEKVRAVYVRYEADSYEWNDHINPREAARRTVYYDDGQKYDEEIKTRFDGLGHYRETTTGGNIQATGNVRTSKTEYRGVFPSVNQKWLTGLYTEQEISEPGLNPARILYDFDIATGFLNSKRVLTGNSPAGNDVIAAFTRNFDGNVIREQVSGGDRGTIYTTEHTYSAGVPETSRMVGTDYLTLDQEIDQSSGLVKRSRDTSGIATTFHYDALGRVTTVEPQESAAVVYTYTAAAGGTPASVRTVSRNGISNPTNLTDSLVTFDPFGRAWQESDVLAGGITSTRETLYNAMGWKTSVSEYGNLSKRTEYGNFDAFGRARMITPPERGVHQIQVQFWGLSKIKRTTFHDVTADPADGKYQSVIEHYDRQGRLVKVEEQSAGNGAFVATSYVYDIGSRLTEVRQNNTGGVTQLRRFNYDNRGFLTSEQLPELGRTAGGSFRTIRYFDYDALGNVGQTIDANNTLIYGYDAGGRLTNVKEPTGGTPSFRPWKDIVYYTAGEVSAGNRGLGKVKSSTRHNHIGNPFAAGNPLVDVTVTETNTYGGAAGRLSARRVSISSGASFIQGFSYDSLGNLASQSYPECENASCASPAGFASQRVPRGIAYGYDRGMLTAVTGSTPSEGKIYASSISYHVNRMLNTVQHGNGVSDIYGRDPHFMTRVASITTTGANQNWTSGTYSYDGAGNITGIGSDWYIYDKVNRVIEGTAQGASQKRQYAYDQAGNMLSVNTYSLVTLSQISAFSLSVEGDTNRLIGIPYDSSGNILGTPANPDRYSYDVFNMMKTAPGKTYIYGPNDERIWTVDKDPNNPNAPIGELITLRGLGNEVLREYKITGGNSPGNWRWNKDYIYRGGKMLASEENGAATGALHYHLDHLGTPRMITNSYIFNGGNYPQRTAYHQYFPFGDDAPVSGTQSLPNQATERLQFTGHEREVNQYIGSTIDYLHARYYSAFQAKFMSIDPGRDSTPTAPQSWNLYAYVRNNPVNAADPTGRASATDSDKSNSVTDNKQVPTDGTPGASGPMVCTVTVQLTHVNVGGWQGAAMNALKIEGLHAAVITQQSDQNSAVINEATNGGGFLVGLGPRTVPNSSPFLREANPKFSSTVAGPCAPILDSFAATRSTLNVAHPEYNVLIRSSNSYARSLLENAGINPAPYKRSLDSQTGANSRYDLREYPGWNSPLKYPSKERTWWGGQKD